MLTTIFDVLRQGWGQMLLQGTAMTLLISIFGMALGVVIGIAGATIKVSRIKSLSLLVTGYTTIVRSVPELLVIYLLYFGSVQTAADIADAFNMGGAMTSWFPALIGKNGRVQFCTPVTNAHIVSRLLLEKKKTPQNI